MTELERILGSARSVALFGGTFDPVHTAHLLLAESAADELGLDAMIFMPALKPPHKLTGRAITAAHHRLAMLRLALAGNDRFVVSTYELDEGDVSYTADTIAWLRGLYPDGVLYLMLGGDSARDFAGWYRPELIVSHAEIAVWARPGVALPEDIVPGVAYRRVAAPHLEISSTDIRDRVAAGRSIRYPTPDSVIDYIQQHGLYR